MGSDKALSVPLLKIVVFKQQSSKESEWACLASCLDQNLGQIDMKHWSWTSVGKCNTVHSQYNAINTRQYCTEQEHWKATTWLRFELLIGDPYLTLTVELWVSRYEYSSLVNQQPIGIKVAVALYVLLLGWRGIVNNSFYFAFAERKEVHGLPSCVRHADGHAAACAWGAPRYQRVRVPLLWQAFCSERKYGDPLEEIPPGAG